MSSKTRRKSKRHWLVTLPRGQREASRDVTWGDVQACIGALNAASEDVFAGLHRCEGGLMCVHGHGFKSEERVDSNLPAQNPTCHGDEPTHKEIRFGGRRDETEDLRVDWPSSNFSFLCDERLTDDWVVMRRGHETHLRFEGAHCVPWTREQCEVYAHIVAQALGLESVARHKRRRA